LKNKAREIVRDFQALWAKWGRNDVPTLLFVCCASDLTQTKESCASWSASKIYRRRRPRNEGKVGKDESQLQKGDGKERTTESRLCSTSKKREKKKKKPTAAGRKGRSKGTITITMHEESAKDVRNQI
jgi:hypothetical protein